MATDGKMPVDAVVEPGSVSRAAKGADCKSFFGPGPGGGMAMVQHPPKVVNLVTWAFAPEWLTVSQACELAGYDRGFMLQVIDAGGVDFERGLIEKQSLWEWLETCADLAYLGN